ncbi:TlpA family protein disulfide reductase [Sphingobacterium hungaricum]|uniref:TlpA family protein disulfide reductase n=1 Tax=Sphingobacterium hungaricum TaxID=2082723 RepID=A0A928UVM5_9SPHI|nr:TlpA disulfide reductase family protein [Sphingobacterium hungaricum]MBE8714055.1 TlpA family protein disulfide reductase [Sphingobacterium hungaricum]
MKKIFLATLFLLPILLFAQTKEELIKQVKANPDKTETLKIIQKVGGYTPDYKELNSLFKGLDKSVRKSDEGKVFERYIKTLERTSVGKKAPGITQFDLKGEPYSLSDLQGKYVLIDFWASWCPDCIRAIPDLLVTYNEFKDKNFDILGVSFDREFAPWEKAVKNYKLDWKHISDLQSWGNAAGQVYGVKSIPQNILVDPKGIIVARNVHGEELRAKLRELL